MRDPAFPAASAWGWTRALEQPEERGARVTPPVREVGAQPLGSGEEDVEHRVSAQPCNVVPREPTKGSGAPLQQGCVRMLHTPGVPAGRGEGIAAAAIRRSSDSHGEESLC